MSESDKVVIQFKKGQVVRDTVNHDLFVVVGTGPGFSGGNVYLDAGSRIIYREVNGLERVDTDDDE
jgi:hypothetical protein